MKPNRLWGLMVEFDSPQDLLDAVDRARQEGYVRMDAYSPMPVEGLAEALKFHTKLPAIVLGGGLAGCLGGYYMEYWCSAVSYPINVAGRPLNSWPMFIPITFEMTVLVSALTAVFAMLMLNGLPRPYHPVFNVPRFALATRDRFFLCIESRDPSFHLQRTWEFLSRMPNAKSVSEVEV